MPECHIRLKSSHSATTICTLWHDAIWCKCSLSEAFTLRWGTRSPRKSSSTVVWLKSSVHFMFIVSHRLHFTCLQTRMWSKVLTQDTLELYSEARNCNLSQLDTENICNNAHLKRNKTWVTLRVNLTGQHWPFGSDEDLQASPKHFSNFWSIWHSVQEIQLLYLLLIYKCDIFLLILYSIRSIR